MKRIYIIWLGCVGVITLLFLVMYVTVQQDFRMDANDPQVQMAEEGARALQNGAVPADVIPHNSQIIDMSESLDPWIMIVDSDGLTALESSVRLGNALIVPPKGALDTALKGENRITWEPQRGVRQAIIIVASSGGKFVVAGRSLREVEKRIDNLGMIVLFGWIGTVVFSFLCAVLLNKNYS